MVTILTGDCREVLKTLPDCSVNCAVTSPPYWGLRDYGTATWEGGDPACEHNARTGDLRFSHPISAKQASNAGSAGSAGSICQKCGARRIDAQIGLERTPEEYVASMVGVFREVRRVLRDDGTLWIVIGDSFNAYNGNRGTGSRYAGNREEREPDLPTGYGLACPTLKPKDMVGIPWRVAFALQADGWYLRSDIIWAKPNPMPESVTDRPTKSHEHIFLLSKSATYYYDAEAIREPEATATKDRYEYQFAGEKRKAIRDEQGIRIRGTPDSFEYKEGRNKRDVWTVPTAPYSGAHFATFPPALITPCILAGCPPAGKRCDCDEIIATPTGTGEIVDPTMTTGRAGMNRERRQNEGVRPVTKREQRHHAVQMSSSPHRSEMQAVCGEAFAHYIRTDSSGARPLPPAIMDDFLKRGWITRPEGECEHPVEPCGTVLDPFGGSGTTGEVAEANGRNSILIELNPEYVELAKRRTAQRGLFC
jgi:DNA modification methylase